MNTTPYDLAQKIGISPSTAAFLRGKNKIPPLSTFPATATDGEITKIIRYYYPSISQLQAFYIIDMSRHKKINPDLIIEDSKKKLDSEEEKEPIDYLTERAIATSTKSINALLKPIKTWMSQFKSLEEVRDNLPKLYDRLNGDAFMQHLEEYMLLSHLAGQSEVIDESIPEADN